ncbi:hypothetical protein JW926_00695 [Candidatus Sumerlaeota bacterium]|nr:hypothetical protein [Candidatus Sumerlaeota bacterium]
MENRISKNTFLLKAKAWLISNPEPEEWLAAEEIPYRAIDLSSKGVFIGTYATLGNKKLKGKIRGNPRCAFDNFIIYRGDVSAIQYNLYSSSEKEIEPILELSDDQAAMELYEFAYKIGPPNSNYAGFDRLMFIEMLFLREIHQWGESCLRANQLMSFFPESPYAARMGGKDGRTEDKAAIEFADATTPMQAGEYKKSHNLFKQFLENYPNNWRHDIAQYRMVFSLYWMAANDDTLHFDVINAMNAVIDENPDSIYLDDIYSLLIGTNIRIGNKQEARKLLDFAMKTFSHPQKQQEYEHLWMDTYLFPSVVDKKELENATQLIDICSERAIKYYEDANDKRAAKYISYLISYYEIVDGEDKLEENLRDFKDKAMKRSKEMHDFIEYTEASYYWHKDREKGIKAYQDLLDSNPEPEIRKECIQKILEFMASKGKDFAELKAFKEKHEKEEQK